MKMSHSCFDQIYVNYHQVMRFARIEPENHKSHIHTFVAQSSVMTSDHRAERQNIEIGNEV